ncbi:maleylacetoacetate isomerase [Bordetella petrii]|uniref:maleylacetoacetate isomerase n=1 Tax=Bordetella petrii TaxID=94624 RepID=UPI001E5AE74D|nr:maleylacetoacetate isomerase [Bordetella petrii]MCD0502845.1 maleylacetoacetate isomerase [Bordetella petrii]
MQLHSFFNSSTSYRVRIALGLKGLPYDYAPVNIRKLEHRADGYVARNPSANVPLLEDGRMALGQSLAIIDYLDAMYPDPRLIPDGTAQRARVLELSCAIACDIHPLNNLRILRYLQDVLGVTDEQKSAWYQHWIREGMATVEALLARHGDGPYCFGAAPTLADCCLVPQIANAQRMGCDLSPYPRAMNVYAHCIEQPAFEAAAPRRQPDFSG